MCVTNKTELKFLNRYKNSDLQITQSDENDMIMIVWTLIAISLVITNGIYILSKKKEVLIRAIYGEDIDRFVVHSIIVDFILFEGIYLCQVTIMQFWPLPYTKLDVLLRLCSIWSI